MRGNNNETKVVKKGSNPETFLFDIPIYWCDEASFNARYEKELRTYEEREKKNLRAKGLEYEPSEDDRRISHKILWQKFMGPWRFNQIVGWVRVYRLGDQVRGEYWSTHAKRFSWQVRKKRFIRQGKAFEIWPGDTETSKQIFNRICQRLQTFENELRGHVIDLDCFKNLGRFVNWRRLIDTLNRQ